LENSGGGVLARPISGSAFSDVMGAYPLFSCSNWRGLADDVRGLRERFVSLVLVPDPASPLSRAELQATFDIVRPMNDHYIIEFARFSSANVSQHHARELRRAEKRGLEIQIADGAFELAEDFHRLYRTLVERRRISGLRDFSLTTMQKQMPIDGSVVVSVLKGGELMGMDWYYRDRSWAYNHLSACSKAGYANSAAYLMKAAAIEYFRGKVDVLDLGGAPRLGLGGDGLSLFKSGWSTGTKPSYLCGAILNETEFRRLIGGEDPRQEGYFPSYRRGDF
jgi:hypothetical protein